jgi:hypothetical protein
MSTIFSRKQTDLRQRACTILCTNKIGWHEPGWQGNVWEATPFIKHTSLPFELRVGQLSGVSLHLFPSLTTFSVEVQDAMKGFPFVKKWYISHFPSGDCCDYYLEGLFCESAVEGSAVLVLKLEARHFHVAYLQALYDEQKRFFVTFGAE